MSAATNAKFMANDAQHGIATAAAAFLCNTYNTTRRSIYHYRVDELQQITAQSTGKRPHPDGQYAAGDVVAIADAPTRKPPQ
ncbi:hypothetical protein ACAG26_26520 [Mycobacterium sp. pUA109]|uniref:hypothetical protein n=1 Tax=Mycobacterium sp. pUA109 TaxID=3238982 RepID=UPI00351BA620